MGSLERPFPALTPSQRFHLETLGYVVVPDVLNRDECALVREALERVKRDLRSGRQAEAGRAPVAIIDKPHHIFMGSIMEAAPVLAACATHPRLVGLAEELIGGEARIVEFNGHINTRNPDDKPCDKPSFDFHAGIDVPFGTHVKGGLTHCSFVKALTNLTDLGPDDGGTVVVAGSHKSDLDEREMIACAYADPNLIHQVIAPAGSTLLFCETLIHATGQIRSDRERAIIVNGYATRLFPYWEDGEMSDDFKAQIPPQFETLLLGKAHWTRAPRYRTLGEAADNRSFSLADGWWFNRNKNGATQS